MKHKDLKILIRGILRNPEKSTDQKLHGLCEVLRDHVPYYDWVGFYFHDNSKKQLYLKAFSGEPTDHTTIPFGKGICGQVALSNQNFIVPDVNAQDNYIACSIHVKAEIVVPIFVNGKNVGQIDIDSHSADPFGKKDEELLEYVTREVANIL